MVQMTVAGSSLSLSLSLSLVFVGRKYNGAKGFFFYF